MANSKTGRAGRGRARARNARAAGGRTARAAGRTWRRAFAAGVVFVLGVGGGPGRAATEIGEAARARWRVLDELPTRGERLSAFAEASVAGVAVADAAGVSWWRDGQWARAQTPPVRDLAFDGSGRLWVGGDEGLSVWARDARPQRRTLRDGETSNRVARIEADRGALVVATEGGAYWSSTGAIFQPLGSGSAEQAVTRIALRRVAASTSSDAPAGAPAAELVEVWSVGGEGLVRTRGVEGASGLRIVDRVLWTLPRPAAEAGVVDLVFDRARTRLHVVYADAIAVLDEPAGDPRAVRWRWVRPVLSPGAAIQRLVFGADERLWLATDHGVFETSALASPWVRAANPAGARDCSDLVEASVLPLGARALALCQTRVLALVDEGAALAVVEGAEAADAALASAPAAADPASEPAPALTRLEPDPPVAEIRRRALERVGLSVDRAEGLWQGLRRKAIWPSMELRGGWDADRDRGRSHNQSFVSGDTRNLIDRDRGDGRHYAATVVLDWELGNLAYPDDSVDLSRELRQVTSLRDDVSDEIHQLYFERQRIRARLESPTPPPEPEAREMGLRAAELDSGLDAWTGGWLSRWRASQAAPLASSLHPGRPERSVD